MTTAKITKGNDPSGALGYVLNKEGAQMLYTNCAGSTAEQITQEFALAQQRHQRNGARRHTQKVVHHASIGFSLDCELSRETKIAIAHQYLEGMGFDLEQHPVAIAEHHDTQHQHIHCVCSRLGWDGKPLHNTGWDWIKAQKVMRSIEEKFGLPPLQNSWETDVRAPTVGEIRKSRKSGQPIPRVVIQQALEQVVPGCSGLQQLQDRLKQHGIEVEIATSRIPIPSPVTDKPAGGADSDSSSPQQTTVPLIFHFQGMRFGASKLGKRYTWKGLQQYFQVDLSVAPEVVNSSASEEGDDGGLAEISLSLQQPDQKPGSPDLNQHLNQPASKPVPLKNDDSDSGGAELASATGNSLPDCEAKRIIPTTGTDDTETLTQPPAEASGTAEPASDSQDNDSHAGFDSAPLNQADSPTKGQPNLLDGTSSAQENGSASSWTELGTPNTQNKRNLYQASLQSLIQEMQSQNAAAQSSTPQPPTDQQIARFALTKGYSPVQVVLLVSQGQQAQTLYRSQGLDAVNLYLNKVVASQLNQSQQNQADR